MIKHMLNPNTTSVTPDNSDDYQFRWLLRIFKLWLFFFLKAQNKNDTYLTSQNLNFNWAPNLSSDLDSGCFSPH